MGGCSLSRVRFARAGCSILALLVLLRHPLHYSTFPFNYVAKLRLTTHTKSVTEIVQNHFIFHLKLTIIPLTNPIHGPHEGLPLPHGVGLTITNPSP